mmetsp:Transcript_7518/g.20317  ORF Transcript_7518/g.20317 Transcript_7518/m.20317 type:complete len:163 (-) Transcript_7518:34-522(-)
MQYRPGEYWSLHAFSYSYTQPINHPSIHLPNTQPATLLEAETRRATNNNNNNSQPKRSGTDAEDNHKAERQRSCHCGSGEAHPSADCDLPNTTAHLNHQDRQPSVEVVAGSHLHKGTMACLPIIPTTALFAIFTINIGITNTQLSRPCRRRQPRMAPQTKST